MLGHSSSIVGDEFRPGFRLQTHWGWSMAAAFFLGEVGAGLFLASLFLDFVDGMMLGIALTAVGKSGGHLLHLGQPLRAWRAIVKLDRSWVSRGLLAIVLFTGFGVLHVLDAAQLTAGLLPRALSPLVTGISAAAAVVVMLYQGFAMSHSSAIALWSSGLMPVISVTYASLGGLALATALGLETGSAERFAGSALIPTLELALIGYALVMNLSLLHAAYYGSRGGQKSVELLLKGDLSKWFLSLVFAIGLIFPAAMIAFGLQGPAAAIWSAAAILLGYFALRVLLFKAAVYDPMQSFIARTQRV
ncbi:MAG: hypothetical protein A3G25_00945 [Betaproteobacteria bacterium RIFCSPLOWO2_12_FULL_63_13]|nr:MAG: hypothetical protein A3H32_20905 [Betaproteobacteria bacterium RIFCSPLOWO2_02_FULL_63_19]OGA50112.1 MAG: hypothetical protein A3G25_00945 [Betaproteobacteria bacterium RIFCSPLOWO2_12_FULL_63_13]